jgi:single-stranded DNA-binding protein
MKRGDLVYVRGRLRPVRIRRIRQNSKGVQVLTAPSVAPQVKRYDPESKRSYTVRKSLENWLSIEDIQHA